jgi:hypothetical protein
MIGLLSRQLGKNVVAVVVGVLEMHAAVDFQADLANFRQPRKPPVILRAQLDSRQFRRRPDLVGIPFTVHDPAFAA